MGSSPLRDQAIRATFRLGDCQKFRVNVRGTGNPGNGDSIYSARLDFRARMLHVVAYLGDRFAILGDFPFPPGFDFSARGTRWKCGR